MTPTPSAPRTINRRALIVFVAVLVVLTLIIEVALVYSQRQALHDDAVREFQNSLELLGELAAEALLSSDYSTAESLVRRWANQHEDIVTITARLPNGFVLSDVNKPRVAVHPIHVEQDVTFAGRMLVRLDATADIAARERDVVIVAAVASAVTITAVLLVGWLLWWTLQRTAIAPLEAEIRRREEKERELLQRTADLEAALGELEAFSYSVSHDLRGPLRAIDGYSHEIAEEHGHVLDDNARAALARTRAAAQRMGRLIDDLLNLARMSRAPIEVADVDLSAIAREVLARCARTDPARTVDVRVADHVRARGDAGLLAVVLENLLENAWKYTARTVAPTIEFGTARAREGTLYYYVRDNGAGFDMKYVDKLFRPFQRLHGAEFPGTGIGLATVARVIARHGGRVWAESAPGQGATFAFTLRSETA